MQDSNSSSVELFPIRFDKNLISTLHKALVFNSNTYRVLTRAVKHGGFIAGGFPAQLLSSCSNELCELTLRDNSHDVNFIADMIHENSSHAYDNIYRLRKYLNITERDTGIGKKGGRGDIDVYFRSIEGRSAFFDELNNITGIDVSDSVANLAKDIICRDVDSKQLIQVVTMDGSVGSPAEVVNRFDMLNAMVAIHDDTIYAPLIKECSRHQSLMNLFVSKQIYVHNIQDPQILFGRVVKYTSRGFHGGPSESTMKLLNETFQVLLDRAHEASLKIDGCDTPEQQVAAVTKFYKSYMDKMTVENLFKLSFYRQAAVDNYGSILNEISDRLTNTILNQDFSYMKTS